MTDNPNIEVIIIPIGGGSGAAGACIVAKASNPAVQVIGVQSKVAPSAYHSWKAQKLVEKPNKTFAEGLATRTAFELPQRILWKHLDHFILVSDAEIKQATKLMIEKTRNLVEPAGAAALAAALKIRKKLVNKRVALVCSGGNISLNQLMETLEK